MPRRLPPHEPPLLPYLSRTDEALKRAEFAGTLGLRVAAEALASFCRAVLLPALMLATYRSLARARWHADARRCRLLMRGGCQQKKLRSGQRQRRPPKPRNS